MSQATRIGACGPSAARSRRARAHGGGAPCALIKADGVSLTTSAPWRSCFCRRLRLPSGHARSAEVPAAAGERILREHVERAAARRGHDRARDAADRHGLLHRKKRRHARQRAAISGDAGRPRSRAGALQHLLHARATTAPAAATAWSCSAGIRSRRRITAIACGRSRPGTSSTS